MASRNPLLDAMNGGGSENPLLDALSASKSVSALSGPSRAPAPSLADTIRNPNTASEVVSRYQSEAQRLPNEGGLGEQRAPEADFNSVLRGLGITTVEAWKQAGAGIRQQAQRVLGPSIDGWIERNLPSAMTQDERRAAFGGTEAEKDYARSQSRSDAATPQFQSDFWEAVYGGLQSTAQTAPGIAAGILGGAPAGLAVLGAQTEAQAYGKYNARGATPLEAATGAIGEGGVEVLTEILPMGFLVNKLGKSGAAEFLGGLLLREMPWEQVATFSQDAIDTAIANPDKTWEQFWDERPDAAYKTAIATIVQSGVYGGVGAIAQRAQGKTANPAYDASVDQAARDAFRPDGKQDVELSAEDRSSPIPDAILQGGKNALADAMAEVGAAPARPTRREAAAQPPVADPFGRMVQITLGSESGNRDLDASGNVLTSGAGAKGRMQVLDGTNSDPGFGVRPAADNSLAERARVGRDYLAAMLRRYGNDPSKMWAAYNAGPGRLDDALEKYGADWLSHMPGETRAYVLKNLNKLGRQGFDAEGGIAPVVPPEQSQMDSEDPIAFAARVLGEDFLSSPTASPEAVGDTPPAPVVPATEAAAPVEPASNEPVTALGPVASDQRADANAPANIRGEAIDGEWSRFSPDSGTLNLPRADMPQIEAAHRGAFANFLKGRGISSHEITIQAANLKPTQAEYSEERVTRASEREGGNRAILVSGDGYVVDGHHQWMAARDKGEDVRAIMLDAPIAEVLRAGHDFPSSFTDEGEQPQQARTRGYQDRRNNIEQDVLSFIAANGGIRDDEGHGLRTMRNLQRPIAGQGSLIRSDGNSIDYVRERLVEAGWLPDGATEADALNLIEDASFRPAYHPQSERALREATNEDEQTAQQDNALQLVRLEAERLGLETLTDRDLQRAAEMTLVDGYSERDALWAALEQAIAEDFNAYPAKAQEEYNVPFDGEETAGWSQVEEPFAEPESGSAGQEGGERSAPIKRAASESESAAGRPSEVQGSALESANSDLPRGYSIRAETQGDNEGFQAFFGEKRIGNNGRIGNSVPVANTIGAAFARAEKHVAEQSPQATDTTSPPEGRTADAAQASPPASAPTPDARVTETVTPEAPRQFEGNRLFTADRVEAARARLKQKLSGTTLNSGIDPEVLMDGMTVAGAYIESGVRRFADVARSLSTDLGQSMAQLRPYLAAWYNGARDLMEGQGEDVSDMDGPGAVRAALTMIEDQARGAPIAEQPASSPEVAATEGAATSAQPGRIEQAFVDAFAAGRAFASITEARAFAAEVTGERIEPGTDAAKALDEAIESAVVIAARRIAVQNEASPVAAYQRLVQLYGQQPRLGVRTSTSIEQQAYSTPVPLAYLASRLAGIGQETTVYEPSAGNGALLIDARATYVTANELNPDRAAALRQFLPGATVTENDAAEYRPTGQFDAVIANPPFGPVKDNAGNTVRFDVGGGYSTNEIDHAIAMKALEAMADNGRAVLIVGGINKTITDPRKRADAYNGKAKREFYFKLYSQYNVTDHFTVDGSLYAKQGAGWPVDVIVIDGRGKSSLRLPAVSAPPQYASWDALQEKINGRNAASAGAVRGPNGSPAAQGARSVATDVRDTGGQRGGRDNGRAGRDQAQQPSAVRDGPDNGQSGSVRMDAERPAVDQAAGDQQPGTVDRRDPVTPEVEENARQVAYQAGSRSGGMGTLVPVNMQTAISDALDSLAQRRGNIDAYVGDRLGYSQRELQDSFGAEQVDAIALAIDNIERGAGFIIGDQTGIGKGRVNAAIIRYAIRTGRNAIFVTEKPNLYADMFRDMEDIGLPKMLGRDINAVMTNSGVTVPLDSEGKRKLTSGSDAKKHDEMLRGLSGKGLKPSNVDVLMTTYSQMQTVRGKATVRQEVIRALANGGVVMFDESHNAGGTQNAFKEAGAAPNRAEFARELVQSAQGVFYSSATYAKRPDVMDLYAATDMKLAVEDLEALGEAIAKGGVPMQQVVAAMLARSGQYVRRERSFDGISYNTPTIEVDRDQYNNVASVLASIQDFSENFVGPAVDMIDMDLRESAENVAPDGSTGSAGAASTNFTAIMHNVVDQMLLAFAANEAATRAIAAIENGEKPVIALASTLETFIDEYASDAGAQPGDKLDITFADIFRRYLERTRRYTVKKPFAEKGEKGERRRLTDEQLGADGVRAFREAQSLIDQAALETLPGSPIDFIISKIEAAGHKVGEITGRSMGIDYRADGTYLKKRGQDVRSIKGRLSAINGFNSGNIDAMILNKSGATGLSLHASEKFKDQRKRRMVIVQADGNIDTHMQMLGRVHRTGQVVLPEYDQLVVGVPAARRPAAVLAKKMASLNANTTASRDSALTSDEVLDFMNVYGDEIAARMMEDEPDIHMRLGSPLSETDKGGLNREEAARKVTGRIPLLPIETQEELYQRLEDEYRSLIAQKDAAGENALEAKTFDFDAETVEQTEAQPPVAGSTSPFADGVYVDRVRVKRTGKPIPGADVIAMVADGLEIDAPTGSPSQALAAAQRAAGPINSQRLAQSMQDGRAYIEQATGAIKDDDKARAEREKLQQTAKSFEAIRKSFAPGDTVRIKTDNGNVYGVVADVYRSGRAKNPLALGVWRARVAIVDAAREMTVSFSQMNVPGQEAADGRISIEKADSIGLFKIIDAFDEMQVDSREERSIVTGNLLAGFDYVNGKGAIINYTASGGQVRQGILLPREFNLSKHQAAKPITLSTPEMIDAFLRAPQGGGNIIGQGKTGQVAIAAIPRRDTFIITAAKAKSSGGEFFLNRDLTAIMGNFVSASGGMRADSSMSKAPDAIRVLLQSGVRFEVPAGASDETKAVARDIVDRMRPPAPVVPTRQEQSNNTVPTQSFADVTQPERSMTQAQRGELEARQQQGMARRGGQEAISDQSGGLFSSEQDQSDLFSTTEDAGQAERDWGEMVPRLLEAVNRLGIADKITVQAVRSILNDPKIAGRYRARIIQVAMASSQDPVFTLEHEAIHAIKDVGLFRPSEWTALEKAAQRDAKLMESIRARYGNLSEERQLEEAVADMFAQWRAGRRSQSGFVRQALQRLLDALTAIRRAIMGANARDEVMDILRRLENGDIGGRDPDGPGGSGGERFSRMGDAVNSLMSSGAIDTIREQSDVWRARLQDRFLPLLRTQQRIEMQSGKALPEQSNAYLAEELMTGKVGARLERLADELVNPLFDTIKGEGLTVDEVETYLYARHAAERNARISSINSEFAEGEGSGMTDAEAASILARADAEGKIGALERAAERVDAILAFALDTRVEAGLLSQEEADTWRDTYEFYVPLRGQQEVEPEVSADRPRFGSGINVRGKESKRAFGRRSRAATILAYSIMQAEEAIARAGRNEVAQAFYNMAQANPDPDFWTTNRVTRKPYWNEASGTVAYRNDSNIQPEDEPFTVSLKIDGQERRVTLNRENPAAVRLAQAMRRLNEPGLSGVLRVMSTFNRFLSRVNTGWNPEFIITNAFRDIQTATVNLAGVEAEGIISGTLRDYRAALVGSWKANVNSDESGEWGKWYREFVDNGGRVYFNHIENVADIAKRIEKQVSANATGAAAGAMKAKGIIGSAFKFVDAANTGLENAIRLAAYKNAREAGMSEAKAASLAKNLTVNFNRRGEWGVAMNAMYLFYNASVQGTARMLQAVATPGRGGQRVRRILGGVALASFAIEMLNAMLSGDDDDGESYYDKISEFEKSRNLILMVPGAENGRYIKIPMPYGYNVFSTIGRSAASVARGRPMTEGLSNIIGGMIDSFNPVGGTTSLLNFIAPTIADPAVDLYLNKDFAERPIYREQSPYGPKEPNSQMYYGTVNPVWKEFTAALNKASGGDEVLPGAVDINPEVLEYLWGTGTGAAGTFVADRVIGTGGKVITGDWENIDANDIPLARKVTGTKPSWYDKNAFFTRTEEIEQIASRPKEYAERGMFDAADAFVMQNQKALSLLGEVKGAKKAMRAIRVDKAAVAGARERGDLTAAQAKDALKEIKTAEDAIVSNFNSAYLKVIDRPKRP